ncbi:hypothetical protein Ct61P_04395 [Colletotrichum tofieldiae]|nr:hypothetical protein Ct61P_04395 [Colletotrichum tofieldiae]
MHQVIGDFKIEDNPTLVDLTVSTNILGFSAGPLLLPPLSETFGKKPVYYTCNVLLPLFNLTCMVAPSAECLFFLRFLARCAGASPITQGAGTATAVMTKEKRAYAMSVMAFDSVCSPAVGSTLGGSVAQVWGWRDCFGFLVFIGSISTLLTYRFMCETYLLVLWRKHTAIDVVGDVDGEINDEKVIASKQPLRSLLYEAVIRPLSLAFKPSILPAIMVTSFFYGLQVWLYIDVPMSYNGVLFHYGRARLGLHRNGYGHVHRSNHLWRPRRHGCEEAVTERRKAASIVSRFSMGRSSSS